MLNPSETQALFQSEAHRVTDIRNKALRALYENQECFVAQWILQNPFEQMSDYRLKFIYDETSDLCYTVEMEKIDVQ